MSNNQTTVKEKKSIFDSPLLSTKVKTLKTQLFPEAVIGYFIGPVLAILSNSVLNAYLNKYYTDVLQLTKYASLFSILLPVVSVIFVILGNLLVGKLMSKARTKAGKARPLMLFGIPLVIFALIFNFYIPNSLVDTIGTDDMWKLLIWVAVGYNLYYAIAFPFYFTSHSAIVNLSTRNTRDRSLLATVSNATTLAATGLISMILPLVMNYFLFVTEVTGVDDAGNDITTTLIPESMSGWKVFVLILAVLAVVGVMLEFYFTRERVTEELFAVRDEVSKDGKKTTSNDQKSVSTVKQFKAVAGDKFWWFIIAFFVLYQLGGMLKNNSQVYFAQAYFGLDGGATLSGIISIVGAIPTALGMVIVWPISNKLGKAKTILLGALIAIFGGVLGLFSTSSEILVLIAFAIKSLGSAPAMYISLALMGDVLDHNEARHGFRSDGLTMTIYGSIMVGMSGLANGIINGVAGAFGYEATETFLNSADGYKWFMLLTYFGGETLCYVLIALIMLFMRVEKYSDRDHRVIYDRQKEETLAQGLPWIEPDEKQRIEQEELDAKNEEDRKLRLQAKCEKLGLDFEKEEAKYQAVVLAKQKAAEEKKAAKEKAAAEAKAQKEKEKAAAIKAKEEARVAALKEYCKKNNLKFEDEEAKYQKELAEKARIKAERKAAWDARIAERERRLDEKESLKDKKAVEMWKAYEAKLAAKAKAKS